MLKNRLFISYATTSLLYIAIVGVIFYMPTTKLFSKKDIDTKVINLKLVTFTPTVITPIDQIEQKEKQKEPEEKIIEKPTPVVEPKPIIKPTPKPKPIVKKRIIKKKKKIIKKKIIKKSKKRTKKVAKHNRVKRVSSHRKSRVSPAKKSAFLSRIRANINRAKSYPRMAKRRGIEGRVRVSFKILRSGKVGAISILGAKVFYNSAKRAIRSAFPINPQKAPISLPMSINLTLVYKIR